MEHVLVKKRGVLGATLMITGCCVGAGTIGLPVLSAISGYVPSIVVMFFSYLFTTGMGLVLLEATLWFDQRVNLLSMAQFALGRFGKWATGFLFLFLFYSIFVAYTDGGGQILTEVISGIVGIKVSQVWGGLLWTFFGAAVVYFGTQSVDYVNRILMIGLIVTFGMLILTCIPYVRIENLLSKSNWGASLNLLPIMFVCFGYQNLVPSITYYLQKKVQALRFAIIIGNAIPFFLYVLWNFVILGVLPSTAPIDLNQSNIVSDLLEQTSQSSFTIFYVKVFSFFIMTTSFITIAMTFVDFLKDGFRSINTSDKQQNLWIYSLVFLPPMLFSFFYTHIFIMALQIAGGIVDVLLFGVLPAFIVWVGRYQKNLQGPYRVGGGKVFLSLILLFCLVLLSLRFIL